MFALFLSRKVKSNSCRSFQVFKVFKVLVLVLSSSILDLITSRSSAHGKISIDVMLQGYKMSSKLFANPEQNNSGNVLQTWIIWRRNRQGVIEGNVVLPAVVFLKGS